MKADESKRNDSVELAKARAFVEQRLAEIVQVLEAVDAMDAASRNWIIGDEWSYEHLVRISVLGIRDRLPRLRNFYANLLEDDNGATYFGNMAAYGKKV